MIINHSDVIDDIKKYPNNFFNTIFSDPPYGLGSKIYVDKKDGKMKFENCQDFMNKWVLTDEQWEEFFKEAMRVLKFGGYCVLFGMDRQVSLVKYYAIKAGFEECQSLYWYYISGFPKGYDISKGIDDRLGEKREVIGKKDCGYVISTSKIRKEQGYRSNLIDATREVNITKPSSDLAKQYEGYRSGVAPLKPCMETILVFRSPLYGKGPLEDVITIYKDMKGLSASVLNINGSRVKHKNEDDLKKSQRLNCIGNDYGPKTKEIYGKFKDSRSNIKAHKQGRYPSQLLVDSKASELI
ncbi:hypothetical protein LCGC14_2166810, partial [marine sediment metagenome]